MLLGQLHVEFVDFLVLALQLLDDPVAIPGHLQAKLHPAFHFVQHVFQ